MSTGSFFQAFIYRLLTTVFYQIMAYFPFRRHLRFPCGIVLLSSGITQIALSAIYAYARMHGAPVTAATLVSVSVGFVVFLHNIRADKRKILFLYIFVLDYVLFVQGLAYYTESLLFYSPFLSFGSGRTLMLILAYTLLTAPFVLFYLERSSVWIFQINAPSFWKVAWMLPGFTTLIVLMYTGEGTLEKIRDVRFLLGRVLLILLLFVVYYILLQALHMIREQEALKEQRAQQEILLSISRTQYRQLSRHMQEVREARHNLAQHLRLIQHYLDTGRKEDLQDYLARYAQTLPADTGVIYCENYAVNILIAYYAEEAKKSQIACFTNIDLPESLPLPEPELCSMLGNLLENALDAAQKMKRSAAPFIRVQGELFENQILFAIDNSCAEEPQKSHGRFLSSKHQGEGTGTASVRATAERYNGNAAFRYKDHVFYVSVFLEVPEEKNPAGGKEST